MIVIFEGVVFVAVAGLIMKIVIITHGVGGVQPVRQELAVNGIESSSGDPCSILNFLEARLLPVLAPNRPIGIHAKTLIALGVTVSLAALPGFYLLSPSFRLDTGSRSSSWNSSS